MIVNVKIRILDRIDFCILYLFTLDVGARNFIILDDSQSMTYQKITFFAKKQINIIFICFLRKSTPSICETNRYQLNALRGTKTKTANSISIPEQKLYDR